MKTKTIRRDWMKRQVEQGKIESRCNFEIEHDGTGAYDRFGGEWMEARIRHPKFREHYPDKENKPDWHYGVCEDPDFIEGKANFNESDFRSGCGGIYLSGTDPEGRKLYSFHIHSNSCYTLREKI